MGYSYGYSDSGRMALVCQSCGKCGSQYGVRKRTCPRKVLTDSARGPRARISYCYPPALCTECYRRQGGARGVHGERCTEGARRAQAEYDAKEAMLEAGELFALTAWGDWQVGVPGGKVGVLFGGRGRAEWRLVDALDYDAPEKYLRRLSDFPDAQPWTDHPGNKSKQLVTA